MINMKILITITNRKINKNKESIIYKDIEGPILKIKEFNQHNSLGIIKIIKQLKIINFMLILKDKILPEIVHRIFQAHFNLQKNIRYWKKKKLLQKFQKVQKDDLNQNQKIITYVQIKNNNNNKGIHQIQV